MDFGFLQLKIVGGSRRQVKVNQSLVFMGLIFFVGLGSIICLDDVCCVCVFLWPFKCWTSSQLVGVDNSIGWHFRSR